MLLKLPEDLCITELLQFQYLSINKCFKYTKKCIHHLKSDLINNNDYMRLSDTNIPSVLLQYLSIDKCFKYTKKCIHHLKSDLINNNDYMSLSDTNIPSVLLRLTVIQIDEK